MTIGLMDWLDSVSTSGTKIDFNADNNGSSYSAFAVNKGLSQHLDSVMFANEMNKRPWLDPEMQYQFLLNAVSKKKRYGKWTKPEAISNKEEIDMVSAFFGVNFDVATQYFSILKTEELAEIKAKMDKGGSDVVKAVKTLPKKKRT